MFSRRELLGMTVGAGATLALAPDLLRALQKSEGKLLQRAIPSTGEMLPVIGVQFRNNTSQDPVALGAVLETLVAHGGRFLDTMHQSVPGVEDLTAKVVTGLGIQKKLFLGMRSLPPGPPPYIDGPPATVLAKAQIESLFARFQVSKLDLVQLPSHADPALWPVLKEAKKAGRVRYIGATTIVDDRYAEIESFLRSEPIDFIGVDYAIDNRNVEEQLLPLARERKVGVVAYFPFGVGSLFQRVGATPLPEWAAEFDARTWAQFFLKYVVGHPAVTVVRAGTTKADHMLDNLGGGIGRLPDEAMRKRMAEFVDALPAPATAGKQPPPKPAPQAPPLVLDAAVLDRYVGEYKTAAGTVLTLRRDGAKLFVKPGANSEAPLLARSETRFTDPRGPFLEFQIGGDGKVTGLVVEQGGQKIPAPRIP
jgi:aryl-alcohol dehydrogenase-like predicted oxidoreductase